MAEATKIAVSIEESKAVIQTEAFAVTDFVIEQKRDRKIASLICPQCKRRIGIPLNKPYRDTCGAVIVAQKDGV